jgi:hypothetical protein
MASASALVYFGFWGCACACAIAATAMKAAHNLIFVIVQHS